MLIHEFVLMGEGKDNAKRKMETTKFLYTKYLKHTNDTSLSIVSEDILDAHKTDLFFVLKCFVLSFSDTSILFYCDFFAFCIMFHCYLVLFFSVCFFFKQASICEAGTWDW